MSNFQGRAQINFTRRSSLSDGWYSAAGAYEQGSERIPKSAWLWVAAVAALGYLVMHLGAIAGF